jgi:hypothetical protein
VLPGDGERMSGFLARVAERARQSGEAVQPRRQGLFEPVPAPEMRLGFGAAATSPLDLAALSPAGPREGRIGAPPVTWSPAGLGEAHATPPLREEDESARAGGNLASGATARKPQLTRNAGARHEEARPATDGRAAGVLPRPVEPGGRAAATQRRVPVAAAPAGELGAAAAAMRSQGPGFAEQLQRAAASHGPVAPLSPRAGAPRAPRSAGLDAAPAGALPAGGPAAPQPGEPRSASGPLADALARGGFAGTPAVSRDAASIEPAPTTSRPARAVPDSPSPASPSPVSPRSSFVARPQVAPHFPPAAPAAPLATAPPPAAPTIRVTIGRVEVRAAPAPPPAARRRKAPLPATSLDEYLDRSAGRSGP